MSSPNPLNPGFNGRTNPVAFKPAPQPPLVMGVVNVTPDSFSDGGQFLDVNAAIAHGRDLIDEGAHIIDVGAESTRPGASPIDEATELARAIPVVAALAPHIRVSIDTVKPTVAEAAVAAGATLINDVSASLAPVAARLGVGWVAMHSRGTPATMQSLVDYEDVVGEVCEFLRLKAEEAERLGVEEIWVDPGIGFAKTGLQNVKLLANLDALCSLGWPVLVGTSRKSLLGQLLAESDAAGAARARAARPESTKTAGVSGNLDDRVSSVGNDDLPVDLVNVAERLEGSIATVTWALASGASMVRVHDVSASVEAVSVVAGSINEH